MYLEMVLYAMGHVLYNDFVTKEIETRKLFLLAKNKRPQKGSLQYNIQ